MKRIPDQRLFELLDLHAPWRPLTLVPDLHAWHADDEVPLWQALEREAAARLPPPFFCIAWPGAQAIALALAKGVIEVRGKIVADIGAGSGLASAAVMRAGAGSVTALDVDRLAGQAARELGRRHGVSITPGNIDALQDPDALVDVDIILAADLIYTADQRRLLAHAVESWQSRSVVVLADSGRPFFDPCGLPLVLECAVEVAAGVDRPKSGARTVRVYSSRQAPGLNYP